MSGTIGSLFAGIGGFDLGFEREGFQTVWQCEIDKAAQGVLRRHFPHAKLHSDVREVGAHNLEPVDVLTYGSPCQDLSISGKRAGLAGERSGLFHEAVRIIRELRQRYGKPDFAIWENVPGAFSSNDGRDFAAVVQAMVDLGARDICWRVLDSRYFGVAQRRRRVFLVADFGGERAEQILFEPESLRGDSATRRKARKGAASSAGAGAKGGSREWPAKIAPTLDSELAHHNSGNQHINQGCPLFVPVAMPLQEIGKRTGVSTTDVRAGVGIGQQDDPMFTLQAGAQHGVAVAFAQNTRDEVRLMGGDGSIVGALAAQPGMKQTTYVAQPIAFHPTQDPISSQDGVSHAMSNGSKGGTATVAVAVFPVPMVNMQGSKGMAVTQEDGPSFTLNAMHGHDVHAVAVCATGETTHALTTTASKGATEDGTGRGVPRAAHLPNSVFQDSEYGCKEYNSAGSLRAGRIPEHQMILQQPMQVRRLTPQECESLQGFPRNWTAEARLSDGTIKPQADGPRYKQLGNAVTVNVAEWIAKRLAAALKS